MSKRFGRNQKRKMREILANESAARKMSEALLKDVTLAKNNLYRQIKQAKEILSYNSILFPAGFLEFYENPGSTIRMPMHDGVTFKEQAGGTPKIAFNILSLDCLLAEVKKDDLRQATHINVGLRGRRWAYALSDMAIRMTPKPILVERISQELATLIAHDLKQG